MHAWSQLTSLALAAVGFILAVWPRMELDDFATVARRPASRLVRFPVFWAGLMLLAYVAAQGLNPAWRFVSSEGAWWLEPVPHLAWLPSGVDAPFVRSNPWRALAVHGSWWLLVCSVWIGFSRRRSYRALFTLLAVNAFFLSLFGVLEKVSGTGKIFWSYRPSNDSFVASFIYPNHGGAYFNLMMAVIVALAWWHYQRAHRQLEAPGLAVVFTFFAVCAALVVVLSYSRMSIVLLLAFIVLAGCALLFRLVRRKGPLRARREFLPVVLALAGFFGVGLLALRVEKVWERFAEAAAQPTASIRARAIVRQAAGEMLRDRWLLGWGAGCFCYNFPGYARRYPEIYYIGNGHRQYWEHVHDDLLEFPLELGLAGATPLAVMLGCGAWQLCRRRFWRNPVALLLVLGCMLALLHAAVDFVFQNPAVLLTWAVFLAGAVRWAELDQTGRHRQGTATVPRGEGTAGGSPAPASSGPILR